MDNANKVFSTANSFPIATWSPTNISASEFWGQNYYGLSKHLTGVTAITFKHSKLISGQIEFNQNQPSTVKTVSFPNLTHLESTPILIGGGAGVNAGKIENVNFPKLVSLNSVLLISNNSSSSLQIDIGSLKTISASFSCSNNSGLRNLSFPSLTGGNGIVSISISNNPNLLTISAPLLTSGTINPQRNASLKEVYLPSIGSVGYSSFVCIDNTSLTGYIAPLWRPIANSVSINFSGCALALSSVNAILSGAVAGGAVSGTLNLNGGTTVRPSGQGTTDLATLSGRSWTVRTN